MESYYDSDEDVCWGPITLREIKRDLTRGQNQVKTGYTRQTIYQYPNIEMESNLSNLIVENLKLNPEVNATASTNLDYCTANETVSSNKSDYKECHTEREDVISLSSDDEDPLTNVKYENISDTSSNLQASCEDEDDSWKKSEHEFVDEGLEINKLSDDEISENSYEASTDQTNNPETDDSFNNTIDELNDFLSESVGKTEANSRIPIPEEHPKIGTNFKVPKTPSKLVKTPSKLPSKLPQLKNNKLAPIKESGYKFKSIVSPVRLYIRNSPLPVLKQNNNSNIQRMKKCYNDETSTEIVKREHKNIVDSFPSVFYKPSETVTMNNLNRIMLPGNIKNLVKEPLITKHVIRRKVNFDESYTSTEWKLQRGDVSTVVSDEKNMSIHHIKQGFNV